jgi:hypothetical protein
MVGISYKWDFRSIACSTIYVAHYSKYAVVSFFFCIFAKNLLNIIKQSRAYIKVRFYQIKHHCFKEI